jgi:glucose-6-phosphate isomerase
MALLAAWITIWNRNCNHYPVTACVPYSYAFQSLFPFIQQLECESNGKTINRNNKKLTYKTAPALISELGTNCQHSFFQMIHQGSDIIPVEFIGIQDQNQEKISCLNAHLYGQIAALSNGEENTDPHKAITANKPSTLLLAKDCSPKTCGELIAFYENKVMFEGFIWDINSFDQFGVEAGKQNALNYLLKT